MTVDPLGTFRNQLTHGIGGSSSRRRRRARTVGVVTLAIVAIVGASLVAARPDNKEVVVADGPSSASSGDSPGGSMDGSPLDDSRCEITQPTEPGLDVPDGWPERPSSGLWYGTADLWTVLPADGRHVPRKSVWWSANFPGGSVEPTPDIAVTWQRLDKPAPLIRSNRGTNAFTPEEGSFMIAGIDPPSAGCWKVTASYRGATLSYVYWNPPRLWVQPLPTGTPNGDTSGIEGEVGFDEINNCYFLERDGLRLPVVWPAGTTVSRNGSIITLADGSTIRLGDHIAGAGGYHQVEEQLEPTIPTQCVPTTGEVAVFNADAKLS